MNISVIPQKNCASFGPKMAIFAQKSVFGIFFETAHHINLKLCQKLGTVAFHHLKTVLYLAKFFFGFFGQFLVKNTSFVVTK